MSENLDHTTGGTFATDDLIDQQTANTKFILIQAAAPSTPYDGQVWMCTSSDPPLLKVYDTTNTHWMENHMKQYLNFSQGYKPLSQPVTLHGDLSLQHDSGSSNNVYLYFKANGLFWGVRSQ